MTRFRLQQGDVLAGAIEHLMGDERADIVYSDPPWGQGNLTYWRTHANESPESAGEWSQFIQAFCCGVAFAIKPGAHIFVEMGTRWVDQLASVFSELGIRERDRWTCYYGSPKRPNVLWHSGPSDAADVSGMAGVAMTEAALRSVAKNGALVLDPCCGKGMTARVAMRLGMRFIGNELNAKRLTETRSWCERFVSGKVR